MIYKDRSDKGEPLQLLVRAHGADWERICAECANSQTAPTRMSVERAEGESELCAWCGKVVPGEAD